MSISSAANAYPWQPPPETTTNDKANKKETNQTMAKPYKPRAVPRGVNLCCPNCQKISVTDDYDHNAPFVNDELLTGWDITCPYCKKLIRCPIGLQPDQPAFFHALFTGIIRVRPGTD